MASSPRQSDNANAVVANFRCENGLCPWCGTKIYDVEKDFAGVATNISPLTIEGSVHMGRCLYCYPDDAPPPGPGGGRGGGMETREEDVLPDPSSVGGDHEEEDEEEEEEKEEEDEERESVATTVVPDNVASLPQNDNPSRLVTPVRAERAPRKRAPSLPATTAATRNVTDDSSLRDDVSTATARRRRASLYNSSSDRGAPRRRVSLPEKEDHSEGESEEDGKSQVSKSTKASSKKRSATSKRKNAQASYKKVRKFTEPIYPPVEIRDHNDLLFKGYMIKGTLEKGEGHFEHTHTKGEHKGKVTIYEGEFANGFLEGKGKQDHAAGTTYVGDFKKGASNGYGTCTWHEGWKYQGEWVDDERSGYGKQWQINRKGEMLENSEVYEGEWKADKRHGHGKLTYEEGGVAEGEFKNGLEDGEVKYVFADGSIYEGNFEKGLRSGQGKMMYAGEGQTYSGRWRNNERNGCGTLFYADGSEYKGTFKDDNIWNGVTRSPDGTEKKYKNGKCRV